MGYIELESHVCPQSVEYAYGRACREMNNGNKAFAHAGMRAARARDPKLLKVLDLAANVMVNIEESQRREEMRTSLIYGERRYSTETQLWREAYRMVDQGTPIIHLQWIYGAAALLAGLSF